MGKVIEIELQPDDPIFSESLTVSGVARPQSIDAGKSDSAEEKPAEPRPGPGQE